VRTNGHVKNMMLELYPFDIEEGSDDVTETEEEDFFKN
jgi:hypothetical protein